jgi:hypothetical protein
MRIFMKKTRALLRKSHVLSSFSRSIPGFTHLSDLASLNRFFDATKSAQQQRKAMQQAAQELAKKIANLESELAGSDAQAVASKTTSAIKTRNSSEPLVFIGPRDMGSKTEVAVPATTSPIPATSLLEQYL